MLNKLSSWSIQRPLRQLRQFSMPKAAENGFWMDTRTLEIKIRKISSKNIFVLARQIWNWQENSASQLKMFLDSGTLSVEDSQSGAPSVFCLWLFNLDMMLCKNFWLEDIQSIEISLRKKILRYLFINLEKCTTLVRAPRILQDYDSAILSKSHHSLLSGSLQIRSSYSATRYGK